MKIFKLDEFWAALVMLVMLVLYETVGIPYEVVLGVAGLVIGVLSKGGLEAWKRRVRAGTEQFEDAAKPKKSKK
jgi:hypothetical protein